MSRSNPYRESRYLAILNFFDRTSVIYDGEEIYKLYTEEEEYDLYEMIHIHDIPTIETWQVNRKLLEDFANKGGFYPAKREKALHDLVKYLKFRMPSEEVPDPMEDVIVEVSF